MSKTLLVTGAAGFIGSTFAEIAVSGGYKVIVLDALTYAGHKENVASLLKTGQAELVVGNICDGSKVSELIRRTQPDAVLNFAAESHVDRSITGPATFIETNIRGTFTLLCASLDYYKALPEGPRRTRFRYLQVSTDEVYGTLGDTGRFSEATPYAPNSPYSASKASADMLVRAWHHTYGLPTLTTNCSNNYGPRQFPEKLIPTIINCALSDQPLPVYGNGGNVRDWIHVEDHSRGILLALENGRPGATYCFGGNAERNNLDVVRTLCHYLDRLRPRPDRKPHESGIRFVKDRPGHDWRYAIDDSLAQKELGFTRQYGFESGIETTVRWYLANQAWCETVLRNSRKVGPR